MVDSRSRLVIPRRRIREIIRGVQQRAVPQLIKIPMKLVRAGLRDVVHLRSSVSTFVHGVGKSIDRYFRD